MNAPPRPPDESRPDALLAIVLISYAMIVIDNSIVITGLPARHLALLSADSKYGDGPTFPFIVDTPQQSGQDPVSLGPMLDNSLRRVHSGQSMVAAESIPGNWVPPED